MENYHHRPSTTVNHQSPPLNPITINDPNNSCNPTTFIQTDPSSFKQVVQLLTGKQPTRPDSVTRTHFKKPSTKLYERRPFSKSFNISPLVNSGGVFSPEVCDSVFQQIVVEEAVYSENCLFFDVFNIIVAMGSAGLDGVTAGFQSR
ncbi:myosin-M heavy chain [Artemisia annua]|uniref:Myosin-M heavy chain n=1 Tax=Artemisia annua TaxID=35608 RepID=A0A2U1QL06_ARTAN|nr:myosin-M heavy chain [Artemisia annua]